MKKILFITYNLDTFSGAAYQGLKLAKYLNKNHKVVICNYTNQIKSTYIEKKRVENSIVIYNIKADKYLGIIKFIFIIIKHQIKIVHFHAFITKPLLVSIFLGRKVILKTTLIDDDDFKTLINKSKFKFVKKFIFSKIDQNIVLSKYAGYLNSNYISNDKISLIPNGVEVNINTSPIKKEKATFCTVGVVCKRKQTYEIIKYFHKHYSELTEAKLYIIGPNKIEDSVPEFDSNYYKDCITYIEKNHLKEKVLFVGKILKEEINDYYLKSKAFIFFSLKEGLPNVVLEAMSFNSVPIITSMDSVAQEIIQNGVDGFIIDDNLQEAISISAIEVVLNSGLTKQKIINSFNFNLISDNYNKLYNSL